MPDNTVCFLFSDIEGSTRLWEQHTERMRDALAQHDAITLAAVMAHKGVLVKRTGDGIHAAFTDVRQALLATLQMQHKLAAREAAGDLPLALRFGLHLGASQARDNDYYGPEVNRAARIMSAAHGGQVLLSQGVVDGLGQRLPAGVTLLELGAVRLRDLSQPQRLWQVLAPPLRTDFPALRSLATTPNNLAQQLNRFIGREQVLLELRTLLSRHRLVTLCGTGGIGKSRLSVQLAATLMDDFPDGVWFVELAPVLDAAQVPQAVARVLGLKELPGQPLVDTLADFVQARQLLLILDNCEHLLPACAALAKRLMQAGAQLKLLATSREVLRVAGEALYAVPTLSAPNPVGAATRPTPELLMQHAGVRLFVDRASAVSPLFHVNADNAVAVAEICHRLDGIPLAIELAAARARALPIETLAKRLIDSFRLVTTQDETVAPRQRTLHRLIDWSHDLLNPAEQQLFRRLAVFAGGWTLDAAEAVCAGPALGSGFDVDDVADLLANLVDKSLVALDAECGRYRLLETVRLYALEKLLASGDSDVRGLHLAFYLALAEAARPQLAGADQGEWLLRLDLERDNLMAAHLHGLRLEAGGATGLRLSAALRPYWLRRGLLSQGLKMTVDALAHPNAPVAARGSGLFDAGQLCSFMGRHAQAQGYLEESLALMRAQGDEARVAAVLQPLGMAAIGQGDTTRARDCFAEAVRLTRGLGDPRRLAAALNAMAQLLRMTGDLDAAEPLYAETLRLARALEHRESMAVSLLNLAMVTLGRQRTDGVPALIAEALQIGVVADFKSVALGVLDASIGLATLEGDALLAARLHGAAQALLRQTGLQRDAADAAFLSPLLTSARQQINAASWLAAEAAGQAASTEPVLDELLAWLKR